MEAWLAQVRHDLVKRILWPARDRRDLGGAVVPGELALRLIDEEGQPTTPTALWNSLLEVAPSPVASAVVDAFAVALAAAEGGARTNRLEPVLNLEAAFEALARAVKGD
jgi:hypothetical protein